MLTTDVQSLRRENNAISTLKSEEIRSLTGLRGVAGFCVVFVHLGYAHPWWIAMWTFPAAAVDFFFCLSGFCLCLAYQINKSNHLSILRYLQARFARIYPLYIVSLLPMWWFVIRHLGGSGYYPNPMYWHDAIRNVFMINTWPVVGSGSNWNNPAWSLSVEIFCYIFLFPLIARYYHILASISALTRCLLTLILIFVNVFMYSMYWDDYLTVPGLHRFAPSISYWVPTIYGGTMFVSGCVAYSFFSDGKAVSTWSKNFIDFTVLLALVYLVFCQVSGWPRDGVAVFGPLLVLGLAGSKISLTARLLNSPPIHWLGLVSYSLYLLHVPVDYGLHALLPRLVRYPVINVCVTSLLVFLFSATSYYFFEMPTRRVIRSIGKKKGLLKPI